MSFEDLEPRPVKQKLLSPANLEPLSIKELEEYIHDMEAEIARVRTAIVEKRDLRGDAEALFKG